MKYNSHKLFSYPVLAPNLSYYKKGEFKVDQEITQKPSQKELNFKFKYELDVPSLHDLVRTAVASFCTVIHCSSTFVKKAFKSNNQVLDASLKSDEFFGLVEISHYIVSDKEVQDYRSSFLREELRSESWNFSKGDVLATCEEFKIHLSFKPPKNVSSAFQFAVDNNLPTGTFRLNPDKDKLQISVNAEQNRIITAARRDSDKGCLLLNSIYVPVVMEALKCMNEDTYEEYEWYSIFVEMCEQKGISYQNIDSLIVASHDLLKETPLNELNRKFLMAE